LKAFKRKHKNINITVFNGHNHTTEYYIIENIKTFVLGGGGATQYFSSRDNDEEKFWNKFNKNNKKELYNFLLVCIDGDKVKYKFLIYTKSAKFKVLEI